MQRAEKNIGVDAECGVVMILGAILLVLLFTALAFAVDLGRFAIAHAEHKRNAASAALAAMTTYWQSANAEQGAIQKRSRLALTDAVASASTVSSLRENIPVFGTTGSSRNIVVDNAFDYLPAEDDSGLLRYGFWHYREPAGSCKRFKPGFDKSCPCKEKSWQGSCFERQSPSQAKEFATAMQLEIFTPHARPFEWAFGKVFGALPRGIRTRATVSLTAEGEILSLARVVENISLPPYSLGTVDATQGKLQTVTPPKASPSPELATVLDSDSEEAVVEETDDVDRCSHGSKRWDSSGRYVFELPAECTSFTIWSWGAGGAATDTFNGGGGGYAQGTIETEGNEPFLVVVGSGGIAACAMARTDDASAEAFIAAGGGGGLTGLFQDDIPVIIAGGGGSAGTVTPSTKCEVAAHGGAGGGEFGQPGALGVCDGEAAGGGNQTQAGIGALGDERGNGKHLQGGINGGGDGYFGGGGTKPNAGGAGGGSGFIAEAVSDDSLVPGERRIPGSTQRTQYTSPAGEGGTAGCRQSTVDGRDGLVVIQW